MKFPKPGGPVRGSRTGAPVMALFDLMGRRWSMGVLWQLCESGPATFRALSDRCEGISPGVLNTRLHELRRAGFITRSDGGYVETRLGRELYEMLRPIGEWSHDWAARLAKLERGAD